MEPSAPRALILVVFAISALCSPSGRPGGDDGAGTSDEHGGLVQQYLLWQQQTAPRPPANPPLQSHRLSGVRGSESGASSQPTISSHPGQHSPQAPSQTTRQTEHVQHEHRPAERTFGGAYNHMPHSDLPAGLKKAEKNAMLLRNWNALRTGRRSPEEIHQLQGVMDRTDQEVGRLHRAMAVLRSRTQPHAKLETAIRQHRRHVGQIARLARHETLLGPWGGAERGPRAATPIRAKNVRANARKWIARFMRSTDEPEKTVHLAYASERKAQYLALRPAPPAPPTEREQQRERGVPSPEALVQRYRAAVAKQHIFEQTRRRQQQQQEEEEQRQRVRQWEEEQQRARQRQRDQAAREQLVRQVEDYYRRQRQALGLVGLPQAPVPGGSVPARPLPPPPPTASSQEEMLQARIAAVRRETLAAHGPQVGVQPGQIPRGTRGRGEDRGEEGPDDARVPSRRKSRKTA